MNERKINDSQTINGTSQSERLLGSLLPDFVKVDERSMTDFLAFAADYADLLTFYDSKHRASGTWKRFFENDISIFLASVITTDVQKIDRAHMKLVFSFESARDINELKTSFKQICHHIIEVAALLDNWYRRATKLNNRLLNDIEGLELELETAIQQKLGKSLRTLKSLDEVSERAFDMSLDLPLDQFDKVWKLEEATELKAFSNTGSVRDKLVRATKRIRLLYRTFYSVLVYVVQKAKDFLEDSLNNKDDHKPDMGLFITFLHLMAYAQDNLNQLTSRHLDYYYLNILNQEKRKEVPDQVNVFFEMGDHVSSQFLPKGSLLEAGLDENGNEILFATDHDIRLNNTVIGALKSIFVSKNRLIGADSSYQLITNIYAAHQANSSDGMGLEFIEGKQNWPTFGEEQFHKTSRERTMIHANVGFAICAPILHLEEGKRSVEVVFRFDKQSASTLNRLILDISRNGRITRETAYFKVFRNSLELQISAEEGWFEIEDYAVIPPDDLAEAEMTIRFEIPHSAPSIISYDQEIHGPEFEVDFPVLKCMLKKEDSDYAYSFLRDLVMDTVFIHVHVDKVRGLNLFNHIGQLDATVPFLPFGPVPKVGSYLLIGKQELFRKELTSLDFNITWQSLPDNEGGWAEYYKAYNRGIENDSFKVRLTALSENEFFPKDQEDQPTFNLFESDYSSFDKLSDTSSFTNINLNVLNIRPDFSIEEDLVFNNFTRSGFFKFELVEPSMAFGSDLFPNLFAEAAIENSKPPVRIWFKTIKNKKLEIPNPPVSPTIKEISLSYSASTRINVLPVRGMERGEDHPEQIFHIHPFGVVKTYSSEATLNRSLVPQFDEDAYLFIGLKQLKPPQRVSLLFEMEESVAGDTFHQRPEIQWSFLTDNDWEPIREESLLIDNTDNFTSSGIVMLDIPAEIGKGNVLLDKDLYWIRVAVKGDIEILSYTVDLHTQAVSATRVDYHNQDKKILEPGQILGLKDTLPAIKAVHQPYPSFGGKAEEKTTEFYTRVSERLRHKSRALSNWDYERMLLEKYVGISQVKCVPYIGNENFLDYGTVLLVVVPRQEHATGYKEPKVTFHNLQVIKDYMQNHASPFSIVEVRNPIYEKLKISCGVIFEEGTNDGIYLEKLNEDIRKFVCPWMFDHTREIELGGILNKNTLLTFVEKLSYVKFVTKFSVVQVVNEEGFYTLEDTARDMSHTPVIQASTPWSVLVPLENHPISFLDREAYQSPEPAGIDTMIIGTDFIIKEEEAEDLEDLRAAKALQSGRQSRKVAVSRAPKSFLKIRIKKKE